MIASGSRITGRHSNRKQCISVCFAFLSYCGVAYCQQTYDSFEGNRSVHYVEKTGVLDSLVKNPKKDSINKSSNCAYYVRNASHKFDNIKMQLPVYLADVAPYATHMGIPPKLKLKVYTTAPAGTLIEILLGSKNRNNDYPAGTNSQYQAHTTKTNQWEQLEFIFSQIPEGSETPTNKVDQVTLLFNPNTSSSDAYYFDDISGPSLSGKGSDHQQSPPIEKKEESKMKTENKTPGQKKTAKK